MHYSDRLLFKYKYFLFKTIFGKCTYNFEKTVYSVLVGYSVLYKFIWSSLLILFFQSISSLIFISMFYQILKFQTEVLESSQFAYIYFSMCYVNFCIIYSKLYYKYT